MSNEIAVYALQDMQVMADAVAKSGLFGMKSHDQALALMLVAQAEGQHPATITQDYDIIQGKACRKTHSVLARFQQMGGKVEWHELTDLIADATFSHIAGGSLRLQWTFDQAKKAGLTNKDNWKNYPRAMLRARVIAEGVRAVYPAAIGGMMIAEEAADTDRDLNFIEGNATVKDSIKVEEKKPEYLSSEIFDAQKAGWEKAITSGKKTIQALIAWIEATGTKLTESQLKIINAWNVVQAGTPTSPAIDPADIPFN